jgi:hypothetical protein
MAVSTSKDLAVVPSGYLTNASHHGLTREAAAAVTGLATLALATDVTTLAGTLKARGVEEALASYTAEFACALLTMADAHERPPQPPKPPKSSGFDDLFDSMFPGEPRKATLAERMPAYVRRATVDCALSAGWACIATLATVDPVRWRATCLVLSDAFGIKLGALEAMTLQSLQRARSSVGA